MRRSEEGREPEPRLYQQFEREHVANWPMQPSKCWRITEKEVQDWLITKEPHLEKFQGSVGTLQYQLIAG